MQRDAITSMVSKEDPNPLRPAHPTSDEDFQEKDLPSQEEQNKVNRIIDACTVNRNLDELIALSTSTGGLINDQIRKSACTSKAHIFLFSWLISYLGPILLGYHQRGSDPTDSAQSWRDLPRHKDEHQVELDVNRSFIYYPQSMSV